MQRVYSRRWVWVCGKGKKSKKREREGEGETQIRSDLGDGGSDVVFGVR